MKPILITIGITIICIVGGLFLLGLPGVAVVEISKPFLVLFLGAEALYLTRGDSAWPFAIIVTIAWPLAIVPDSYITLPLQGGRLERRWIIIPTRDGIVVVSAIASSVMIASVNM